MATFIDDKDSAPVIRAAQEWVKKCVIQDVSVFSDDHLWTRGNLNSLDKYFSQNLEAGTGRFYEKLKSQLQDAPPSANKLMAEMLWALFLFPDNIRPVKKRDSIVKVWSWSGDALDPTHPMLADAVLNGIGSGGMGVNNHRWRELVYMIGMATQIKEWSETERHNPFRSYETFVSWIDTLPQDGERQFRQMLRYLLFPERVERMSSNGDRVKVLAGFGIAAVKDLRKWSDTELDAAMMTLRGDLEAKYDTKQLDFYRPPLREVWKAENEPDDSLDSEVEIGRGAERDSGGLLPVKPRNWIFFGPPGTGKTFCLQQLSAEYTDQAADVEQDTWQLELVARFGWRAVIVTALSESGRPTKVAQLADHPLIRAKASERERKKSIQPTLWSYLQEHTPPEVKTVNSLARRPPFVFTKSASSEWSLLSDWRDTDAQSTELADAWVAGPGGDHKPVRRYRFVTFHPSYSYEDFVIGLRPLASEQDDDHAQTEFRMVDGVFKQICTQAKANPSKRYALFIDEINRGNVAKIFGELITLIEGDKRARYDVNGGLIGGLEVQLPGIDVDDADEYRFGVPENLDIFGTMNTADRSIALLDIAFRRRFEFRELVPIYEVLNLSVEGVHLGKLLRVINDRLEYLIDRDRQIGHAYFMRIKSLDDLRACFKLQIIPLLQEYFFDDLSRVQLVLSRGDGVSPFISRQKLDGAALFGGNDDTLRGERWRYDQTAESQWTPDAFLSLYERQMGADFGPVR